MFINLEILLRTVTLFERPYCELLIVDRKSAGIKHIASLLKIISTIQFNDLVVMETEPANVKCKFWKLGTTTWEISVLATLCNVFRPITREKIYLMIFLITTSVEVF